MFLLLISFVLLGLSVAITCFGWLFDLEWSDGLGALFELIAAVIMLVFLISLFFVDAKYEAIKDGKIETYSECYKEHGLTVCEDAFNRKVIVDDYWKQ